MEFHPTFAPATGDWHAEFEWQERLSQIKTPDGRVLSEARVVVPSSWSQIATDILADKYLRKRGVPSATLPVVDDSFGEPGSMPVWLLPSRPARGATFGPETDLRQVLHRLAGSWTYWGWRQGVFAQAADPEASARAFYRDLCWLMAAQYFAPASPQWFNAGLHWAYGIDGPEVGLWCGDGPAVGGEGPFHVRPSGTSYERPQVNACFIQSVRDSLLGHHGIASFVERESRVFKFGGGSGANVSDLRAENEPLSAGGKSSGLMSWLPLFDRGAGAIKSGGTTRRAAKMIVLDLDHPDIEQFVAWKPREERKVAALVAGSRLIRKHARAILDAACNGPDDPRGEAALDRALESARADFVPERTIQQILARARSDQDDIPWEEYDTDWQGEGFRTVSAQNANNSVSVPAAFLDALQAQKQWPLYWRTEKRKAADEGRDPAPCKTVAAKDLWGQVVDAAWECGDPAVQFADTVNAWNPCLGDGLIRSPNPCSEYQWLDDTACNLGSIRLTRFCLADPDPAQAVEFDFVHYRAAVRLTTVVLDITVGMAGYPSEEIARGSWNYRTLGLGYADLGALLMRQGLPYDSCLSRQVAGALTAILHCQALVTSAELASELGAFPRYEANRGHVRRVVGNHAAFVHGRPYEQLAGGPQVPAGTPHLDRPLLHSAGYHRLANVATDMATEAEIAVRKHGLRNAQVSLLAPTGTIGLLLDCDTTGVEPDYALVKHKKLAGGGYLRIINQSVPAALAALGYLPDAAARIVRHALGDPSLAALTETQRGWILGQFVGPDPEELATALARSSDVRLVLPGHHRLTDAQVEELNLALYGHGTLEGAPGLDPADLPVFDCASRCGRRGTRLISPAGHVKMMAAVQPALSGAISKTVNLPREATREQVSEVYLSGHPLGVKAIALYRDGSKLSQPLGSDDLALDTPASVAQALARVVVGRRGLPTRRRGYTQKVTVGGHKFYLTTGEYDDGSLGEIFLVSHQEGAPYKAILGTFAIAVSLGLQYGVPLEEFVDAFCGMRFDPSGPVRGHGRLRMVSSLVDVIFRDLAIHYLGREDLAQIGGPAEGEDVTRAPLGSEDSTPAPGAPSFQPPSSAPGRTPGYEGFPCPHCQAWRLVRKGACLTCEACGTQSGCQ